MNTMTHINDISTIRGVQVEDISKGRESSVLTSRVTLHGEICLAKTVKPGSQRLWKDNQMVIKIDAWVSLDFPSNVNRRTARRLDILSAGSR
jgi:hypothetical protein